MHRLATTAAQSRDHDQNQPAFRPTTLQSGARNVSRRGLNQNGSRLPVLQPLASNGRMDQAPRRG